MTFTGFLDRMAELERHVGLHYSIEIIYVVDGYDAKLVGHDGSTVMAEAQGDSIIQAIDKLAKVVQIKKQL